MRKLFLNGSISVIFIVFMYYVFQIVFDMYWKGEYMSDCQLSHNTKEWCEHHWEETKLIQ